MPARLRLVLLLLAAAYAGLCLLAYVFQRRLLYQPARYPEPAALAAASRLGLAPHRDARGALAGWRAAPRRAPIARVLVLHGNAGSALDRAHYAAAFTRVGAEVLLLEYPGYGARPGDPSLRAIEDAAAAAVDDLARRGPEPVWVLGESLGSGVAGRAVALRPSAVHGLVLVTPFARLADVARARFPLLPSFLLRDRYDPARDLAAYRAPAFVILAGRDEVVGADQGRRLYDALGGPKRLVVQDGAGHDTLDLDPSAPLWREVGAFLSRPPPSPSPARP